MKSKADLIYEDEYYVKKKITPAKKVSNKLKDKARATWYKKQMRLRNLEKEEWLYEESSNI
jgi:hypothetical protein